MSTAATLTFEKLRRAGLLLGSSYGGDIGGTYARSAAAPSLYGDATHLRMCTGDHASLHSLLATDFVIRRFIPEVAVLALPGSWEHDPETGRHFTFTNLGWQPVTEADLASTLGIGQVKIINDLQAALLGARCVNRTRLTPLKQGSGAWEGRNLGAATFSTGYNRSTGTRTGALPLGREEGHVRLATDPGSEAARLIAYHYLIDRKPLSTENLISGGQGIYNIVAYLMERGERADERTMVEIMATDAHKFGELMTPGALAGDKFWVRVANIYGELLGYALHEYVTGELIGELFLQGSVLNGTPGFAEWLFDNTRVLELLVSAGMEKEHLGREVQIWGVPEAVNMAALGAQWYAAVLLTAQAA